jgi:hypothetical protein
MSITSSEILAAVNNNLHRSETDIDEQIRAALKVLSGAGNFLAAEDGSQTLSLADTYLDEPADYKALEAIVLNDGTNDGEPLSEITFGEYLGRKEDESSADYDEPLEYAHFNNRFYVEPAADGSYTATIYYYRYHPDSITTILFDDQWRDAIYSLTSYLVAKKFGLSRYIEIYGGNDVGALALALSKVGHNENIKQHFVKYRDI